MTVYIWLECVNLAGRKTKTLALYGKRCNNALRAKLLLFKTFFLHHKPYKHLQTKYNVV